MRAQTTKTLKTCKWCKTPGLVWYLTKRNGWMLAKPKADLSPDPMQVHLCELSPQRVYQIHQRSYKASSWRRGKSPSSYG
jgi:hypothetical protein